ncbi:hypothetical protein Ddye_031123 [Dipteronia dyeriana]|uniref:CBS domain-containing protein n=1 Tax=Dipteronia dyeriana TaxID=168575 RepID=A0AAD9WM99_9ROSI|nr:hypothetical protein Ddye_031123 [Dipteronia dyeriana]
MTNLFYAFSADTAQAQEATEGSRLPSFDAYFETIQLRKILPHSSQETLTAAVARIHLSHKFQGAKSAELAAVALSASSSTAAGVGAGSTSIGDDRVWKDRGCKGRDWFDCTAARPIFDLGLPFMSSSELNVRDFMNTVVSTTTDSGRVMPPITCRMESTLGSVIHSLAFKSVHRIYVVADYKEDEVVGVITLRDVISLASYISPLSP